MPIVFHTVPNNDGTGYVMDSMSYDNSYQGNPSNRSIADLDDSAYLAAIAQYSGTPYYDYLLNNPFLGSKNGKFSPTFWQRVASWFGDTSAEDQYYSSLNSNRQQWLSEALERFRQEQYNSPAEQVARQRAAGLNPDLNGSVDSGSAAENDQPIQPLEWPNDTANETIKTIGTAAIQFVSNVMGLAQSFQSLKLGNQQLVAGEIANNENARDFVLNQIAGTSFFNSENDLDHISPSDLANNIISASSKVDYSIYSPATRKLMKRMFNRYAKDVSSGKSPLAVEELKSELRKRVVSNNQSAINGAASPLFDEDFNEWLRNVSKIFGRYEYEAQVNEYKERLAKSKYNTTYFHHLDPEKLANAENSVAGQRDTESTQYTLTEGMWNDVYKLCSETKTWYGTLGLILIPYLRSFMSTVTSGGLNLRGMITNETKNFNKFGALQ